MIEFDYKGIKIDATVVMTRQDYRDSGGRYKSRFDRDVKVIVVLFRYFTIDGNLTELVYVKSILNYYMQAYWKRSSKEGSKIDLAKVLHHGEEDHFGEQLSLNFIARQKNKRHFLEISLISNSTLVMETYLDGQEVLMLDIALGKAISLLTPEVIERVENKTNSSESKQKITGPRYITSYG